MLWQSVHPNKQVQHAFDLASDRDMAETPPGWVPACVRPSTWNEPRADVPASVSCIFRLISIRAVGAGFSGGRCITSEGADFRAPSPEDSSMITHSNSWPARAAAAGLLLAVTLPAFAQGRVFARLDTDGSGAISRQEALDARAAAFAKLDADGDGYVTAEEREQARENRRQHFADQAGGGLEGIDADGDGRVSRDEFMSRPTAAFDRADADNNGELTRDETKRFVQDLRAQR